jgi:hypothetical protein
VSSLRATSASGTSGLNFSRSRSSSSARDAVLSEGLDGVDANAGAVGGYPHHGALVLERRLLEQLGYLPDDARVAVLIHPKQMFGAEANTESIDTHVMSQVPGERKP